MMDQHPIKGNDTENATENGISFGIFGRSGQVDFRTLAHVIFSFI
jgi:hypothetical protein